MLEALRLRFQNHIRQPSFKGSQLPQPVGHHESPKPPQTMSLTTMRMLPPRRTSTNPSQNLHLRPVPLPSAHRTGGLQLYCQPRATPLPSRRSSTLRR